MDISIFEGLMIIEENSFEAATEIIPIENSAGRIAASNIKAKLDMPRFSYALKDGYCTKSKDANKPIETAGLVAPGDDIVYEVTEGKGIKILAGSKIPKGCDAVIEFEEISLEEGKTILPPKIKKNSNIIKKGSYLKRGETIVKKQEEIAPHTLSLLFSQGITHIEVFKKPSVAILPLGNDVKLHFETSKPNEIYNASAGTIEIRTKELLCNCSLSKVTKINKKTIKERINNYKKEDIIFLTGGKNNKENILIKEAIKECGFEIVFEKICCFPFGDIIFATKEKSFLMVLPPYYTEAIIMFEIFGKFLINHISQRKNKYLNFILAFAENKLSNQTNKELFVPGLFDGEKFVSSKFFNGFIVIDRNHPEIKKGEIVKFIPLEFNFFTKEFKEFYS